MARSKAHQRQARGDIWTEESREFFTLRAGQWLLTVLSYPRAHDGEIVWMYQIGSTGDEGFNTYLGNHKTATIAKRACMAKLREINALAKRKAPAVDERERAKISTINALADAQSKLHQVASVEVLRSDDLNYAARLGKVAEELGSIIYAIRRNDCAPGIY